MRNAIVFIPILIAVLSTAAYAASITSTTQTIQAQSGQVTFVTGAFSISVFTNPSATGFTPVAKTAPATPAACTWTPNGNCSTALIAGDWSSLLIVTLNTPPAAATTFLASVGFVSGGNFGSAASTSVFFTLPFSVPSGMAANTQMAFIVDTGFSTLTSPVTVNAIIS